ncbi:MAG TPA: cell division protein, partial [Methylophaga sp.]|nr:cell division protein [Methylophaga sp.]
GMGVDSGAYFPGEAMGRLPDPRTWRTLDRATLAYGYGLATNTLQLARAYTIIGNGGIMRDVTFIKQDKTP